MTAPWWAWTWLTAGGITYLACIQGILRTRFWDGLAVTAVFISALGVLLPGVSILTANYGDQTPDGLLIFSAAVISVGIVALIALPMILRNMRWIEVERAQELARQEDAEAWIRRFGA